MFEELDHGGLDSGSLLGLELSYNQEEQYPMVQWEALSILYEGLERICMKVHHEGKEEN